MKKQTIYIQFWGGIFKPLKIMAIDYTALLLHTPQLSAALFVVKYEMAAALLTIKYKIGLTLFRYAFGLVQIYYYALLIYMILHIMGAMEVYYEILLTDYLENYWVLMEGQGSDPNQGSSSGGGGPSNQQGSDNGGQGPSNKVSLPYDPIRDNDEEKPDIWPKLESGVSDDGVRHTYSYTVSTDTVCDCCSNNPCKCGGPQKVGDLVKESSDGTRLKCYDIDATAGLNSSEYPCCKCGEKSYNYHCSGCGCVYCKDCHSNH